MDFGSLSDKLVALLIALAVLCCLTPICLWGAGRLTEQKFKRRERGRTEAQAIGETLEYVSRLFAERYMPISLCQLVAEARQCQRDLLRRSWLIENRAQLNGIRCDAIFMRDRLVLASSAPFSAEAQEADRLALIAELVTIEVHAEAERASAEAAYVEELERVSRSLACNRQRIAEAQVRLAALTG